MKITHMVLKESTLVPKIGYSTCVIYLYSSSKNLAIAVMDLQLQQDPCNTIIIILT